MLYIGRKVRQFLSRENGQSMVEMALLMCFAVVLFLAIDWDGFRGIAGGAYQSMADSMELPASNTEFTETGNNYSTMPTSDLMQVDNAERIAADKATITALGEFLLTRNKSQIKELFPNVSDTRLTGNDSSKPGVGLFDYNITNTGDNGEALKINLRNNGTGYLSNQQTVQWMKGNFDTNTSNYPNKAEEISYRLFYSDNTIDPKPVANVGGVQSATLWASFTFDNSGEVTSVKLDMTRSYQVGNKWERISCEGLSDIVVSR